MGMDVASPPAVLGPGARTAVLSVNGQVRELPIEVITIEGPAPGPGLLVGIQVRSVCWCRPGGITRREAVVRP